MWKYLFGRKKQQQQYITIVSGLPRSGTSMMMKMLEAGGMEVVVDHIRQADDDNPNGYYEFEKAKKIKEDASFLDDSHGKVFKMVSMLLYDLPKDKTYKIIFMRRNIEEILASQEIMLQRSGKNAEEDDDTTMGNIFEKHINEITKWIAEQPNINITYVNYNDVMRHQLATVQHVNQFLENKLDVQKMVEVVDPTLYRNRVSHV
jgi:hypothetical protein